MTILTTLMGALPLAAAFLIVGAGGGLLATLEDAPKEAIAATQAQGVKKAPPGLLDILKLNEKESEKKGGEAPSKAAAKTNGKPDEKKAALQKGEAKKEGAAEAPAQARLKEKEKAEILNLLKAATRKPVAVQAIPVEIQQAAAEAAADPKAAPAPPPAGDKAAPPPRKREPLPPMFRLRDGTRLAGVPDLERLNIATPYGKLVVPVSEVVRVRFAAAKDQQLAARINDAVSALGSEEFDRREEAMASLREIGLAAIEALRKALESEDEEVKSRAEKLLGEAEEERSNAEADDNQLSPVSGEEDEVVTLKFTVLGQVEEDAFTVASKYGALKLSRKDIVSVVFQDSPTQRVTLQLPGTTFAGNNKWHDTKVRVTQGAHVFITASGSINLENYGQATGPEGTANISGNQHKNFPTGCLVGKIGDKGQEFQIGQQFDGNANASGNLQLGVSLREGQVSGQFAVTIEVEDQS